jgi:hypothetical protein
MHTGRSTEYLLEKVRGRAADNSIDCRPIRTHFASIDYHPIIKAEDSVAGGACMSPRKHRMQKTDAMEPRNMESGPFRVLMGYV